MDRRSLTRNRIDRMEGFAHDGLRERNRSTASLLMEARRAARSARR